MNNRWTIDMIPDLSGKTAIVTGANSGLGYEIALELAKHNCEVTLACRNLEKGEEAKESILKIFPQAKVRVSQLDLSDLSSIQRFCQSFAATHQSLSILINNAGINRSSIAKTKDGFDFVFQTNYLGPFALTAQLYPLLAAENQARVVNISSILHTSGKIDFNNLNNDKNFSKQTVYSNTKLANLLFTFELQRRIHENGQNVLSVAAHPGYAKTHILLNDKSRIASAFFQFSNNLFAQSAAKGSLPILYACVGDVSGGDYYGPNGFMGIHGDYPKQIRAAEFAYNEDNAKKLWDETEKLLGIKFKFEDLANRKTTNNHAIKYYS